MKCCTNIYFICTRTLGMVLDGNKATRKLLQYRVRSPPNSKGHGTIMAAMVTTLRTVKETPRMSHLMWQTLSFHPRCV